MSTFPGTCEKKGRRVFALQKKVDMKSLFMILPGHRILD